MHKSEKQIHFSAMARPSIIAIVVTVLAEGTAVPQNSRPASPLAATGNSGTQSWKSGAAESILLTTAGAGIKSGQTSDTAAIELAGINDSRGGEPARPAGVRRITLEQVKQSVAPVASPLARLGQFSIEAAKQHRLGVQADYFPKFGATFFNLHFTEFLGQVLAIRRPIVGVTQQVPVPLLSQNQTIAALTFTQPITPLFMVHQAVRIARADERIALAKAGVSVAKNIREAQIEETYFKLLIAQRRLTCAEFKVKSTENRPAYAGASFELAGESGQELEMVQARKALETAATEVKQLTASLNSVLNWPPDTTLELVAPDPLVESISLEEVADKSVAANPDVIEAQQTVVKARAAATISKLEYVPTVAAVGGYLFQNTLPSVPSNFAYGGVMASYNLFDFGKREHAVKEARAQLGMAEIALQMTKAKVAANVKKSYFELERARQLSQLAQKMGAAAAVLVNGSSDPQRLEAMAARTELEVEMLEADLAHRQAFAHLRSLMSLQQ